MPPDMLNEMQYQPVPQMLDITENSDKYSHIPPITIILDIETIETQQDFIYPHHNTGTPYIIPPGPIITNSMQHNIGAFTLFLPFIKNHIITSPHAVIMIF